VACQALADLLGEHGLPLRLDDVFRLFLGRSFQAVEAFYRERLGTALPPYFRGEHRRRLELRYRDALAPIPGVANVLAALDRPYCVASSSDPGRIAFTLDLAGLGSHFGTRVFSATQVERGKPAPDLFLFAARMMDAPPARCLVVEDTEAGVQAGKAAGMTVWGFTGGSHCNGRDVARKLSAAGADRVFDRMPAFFME
jgi:HAD superfamily hydrolase (TIGR01509 family)